MSITFHVIIHSHIIQHCFHLPLPPNLTISKQCRHFPQSSAKQPEHLRHLFRLPATYQLYHQYWSFLTALSKTPVNESTSSPTNSGVFTTSLPYLQNANTTS